MAIQLNDSGLLKTQAYIDGNWTDGFEGKTFAVTNPANGEHLADVADLGAAETRQAIEAASRAMKEWRALSAASRSAVLEKWHALLLENQEDLAILMTAEQGKPMFESRGEVAYGASYLKWFAEEGKRVYGDIIPTPQTDRRGIAIKQPVGVVAAITPWNFPNAMITRKVAPALAVGCAIVLKPRLRPLYQRWPWLMLAERAVYLPAVQCGDRQRCAGHRR